LPEESQHIPFFPLDTFLLPTEQRPLHIFEPRYKQLFDDIEKNDVRFGLPFPLERSKLALASVCKLEQVLSRKESGERDVLIQCESVHYVVNQYKKFPGKAYPGGEIGESINGSTLDSAPIDILEKFADIVELRFNKRPQLSEINHYKILDVAVCSGLSHLDKVKIILSNDSDRCADHLRSALKYLHFICLQESKSESGIFLN
jgi:uncharacterized protein